MQPVRTAGQVRRRALQLAADALRGNKGMVLYEMQGLYRQIIEEKLVPLRTIGLAELNALGLVTRSIGNWHKVPLPLINHTVNVVVENLSRVDVDSFHVWHLLQYRDPELSQEASEKIIDLCDHIIPIFEQRIHELEGPVAYALLLWVFGVHSYVERDIRGQVPLSFAKVQFMNQVGEKLAEPESYAKLSLKQCSNMLFSFAQARLTPEGLYDNIAVHVMDELLPKLRDKYLLADDTTEDAAVRRKGLEVKQVARVISAFSKAAELGRVPLRDVLECLARYVLDSDGPLLHMLDTQDLVRVSYLSVAVSKKWGAENEPIDETPVKEVLEAVGELSLTEAHCTRLLEKHEWQWRFLLNMTQAGQIDTVTKWMDLLISNPDTDPKLLATLTYAVARVKDGLGYRDMTPHKTQTDEQDNTLGDDEETATVRSAVSYFEPIKNQYIMPKLDKLGLRQASYIVYAYARESLLCSDLAIAMIEIFCTGLEDQDKLVPPFIVTNFVHSLAIAMPEGLAESELALPFEAIEKRMVAGALDITPEKPNHTVHILWSMQKARYVSRNLTSMLCELLPAEAIERLHLSTAAMAVDAISKHPFSPIATGTAVKIVNLLSKHLEYSGTTNALNIDIMALALSRGPWNKEDMIDTLFGLSKAFMMSGSEKALLKLSGKSLSRILWSHSVVMVKHTLLCDEIVQLFEDREFMRTKMAAPLEVTSALVAMSRLRLKNARTMGNLCSMTATMSDTMTPISLADMVQAMAELGLPSRGLQVMLCARVVHIGKDFTGSQAASFTWNLARSRVVPNTLNDLAERGVLVGCYSILLPKIAKKASSLDVKHICRTFHTLGLISDTHQYPNLVPPLYKAVLADIENVWWRDLANFLWGLAMIKHLPPDEDLKVLSRCRSRQSFTPEDEVRVSTWDAFVLDAKQVVL